MDNSITDKGFELPNHTQTPNSLFDYWLEKIDSLAELKVTLAIIRKTFGWHKQEDTISISQLMKATGLSRQGVVDGLEAGLKRGLIVRRPAKRNGFCYGLRLVNDLDQSKVLTSLNSRLEIVNDLDQSLVNDLDTQNKNINKINKGGEQPPPANIKAVNLYIKYGGIPNLFQKKLISETITDLALWEKVLQDWLAFGWQITNVKRLLEAYRDGGIKSRGQATAPPAPTPAIPKDEDYLRKKQEVLAKRAMVR